jgi:hypothetical protein
VQPTLETELRAIRASLERLRDAERSPETAGSLTEVIRSLRRLERAGSGVLPFLRVENVATRALLGELAPSPATDLPPVGDPSDATGVNDENGALRERLSGLIAELPDGPESDASLARIRDHLLTTARRRPW